MYFEFIYGNRSMKTVEIVPKWGRRENNGGSKPKIHFKHICKHHDVFPCTDIIC
jgi:hypothetical protein